MKILIIRFSSIGDIAQTSPIVRCVRKRYPDADIHFLTKPQFAGIVAHNPYINKLILLNSSLLKTIGALRAEKYDVIIDLHHNLRTFIIKSLLLVKSHSFPKLNIEKWLLTTFKINRLPQNIHLVDRYFEACNNIGVSNDGLGLEYFLAEGDNVDTTIALPKDFADGFFVWIIGAKFFTKVLPKEKVVDGITLLLQTKPNAKVVLIGGKEDAERGDFIAARVGTNVYNACGKFSLNQSVSLVKQAKVVIGNDTGLTQIAPAFDKPLVSLWGSTSTVFGVAPYFGNSTQHSKIIEVKDLACRPCTKFGRNECPKGHFDCMNKIDMAEVVKAVESIS